MSFRRNFPFSLGSTSARPSHASEEENHQPPTTPTHKTHSPATDHMVASSSSPMVTRSQNSQQRVWTGSSHPSTHFSVSESPATPETWFLKKQQYELIIEQLQHALQLKDIELDQVRKQLDKARSVLSVTNPFSHNRNITNKIDEEDVGGTPDMPRKKQGISGESSSKFSLRSSRRLSDLEVTKVEKDFRSKHVIKDALHENDFLANLDSSQTRETIDYMYPLEISADSYIIRQGDEGNHLYVLAEGEVEVIKDDKTLGKITSGKAFGELAILYNCTRTASVRAITQAKLWVLDRSVFQVIMMRNGLQRQEEIVRFLRSVPYLKNLEEDKLRKVADALQVEYYSAGSDIIREGESGDTFFVLYFGEVRVTQKLPGKSEPLTVRMLEKGRFFGEKALLQEERRTATITAITDVECLTLDRESFTELIGDLRELKEHDYGDEQRKATSHDQPIKRLQKGRTRHAAPTNEYAQIQMTDLEILSTLGQGGFGRVVLVQLKSDRQKTFALKCMKKIHIVKQRQQEHVLSEKNITLKLSSPFICRMYNTYKDRKYLYMLMEVCLGGELWTILRDRNYFDDYTVRFYTGCAVLALEYLHERCIIYRDLKPENVLLDVNGYAKIADFGFAKDIEASRKTWTFCGTPQYIAPEIILNKGHDHAVDFWALGIFMFELSTGNPPFDYNGDQLQVYNNILRGLSVIEFPRRISRNSQSLMKRLCKPNPVERLGYQKNGISDIKRHKFFQGFDWSGLANRTLEPPIKPNISGPTDTTNFDQDFPPETDMPPDEMSGWDESF